MQRIYCSNKVLLYFFITLVIPSVNAQTSEQLIPPILLENEQRLNGNPLATYSAMIDHEEKYAESHFADFYDEVKLNLEQFMGIHESGLNAMGRFIKRDFGNQKDSIPENFKPLPAISIIEKLGKDHQIIMWGEEHHLPQTRVLFEEMLKKLWQQGFRYLAAETFSDEMEIEMKVDPSSNITANSGYYLQDPVYANAVRLARELGYTLISYDNKETERDKKQAQNIFNKVFKNNPEAKVLILAGRSHVAESKYPNFEPMGYWLKEMTGIDPVSIYAPTMTDRLVETEKHPLYRYAIENDLLQGVTIFKDTTTNSFLGSEGAFDIYPFFPPTKLIHGRPDWLFNTLNRNAVEIPEEFLHNDSSVLIQAREIDYPDESIPVDQLLVLDKSKKVFLALPVGEFRMRSIDAKGKLIAEKIIKVQ